MEKKKSRRKRIAVITAVPENQHGSMIIEGIRRQCAKYHYDCFIMSAMCHLQTQYMADYIRGEANIFELLNLEEVDGLIIDTVSVFYGDYGKILERIKERIAEYPDLPVNALELPIEGVETIRDQNEEILREMCRHMVLYHGKRNIALLTGQQGNEIAEERLRIFRDELLRLGVEVPDSMIHYGDFYYTGGDAMGRRILDEEMKRPDAVIAASDTMAIGLMTRLREGGLRVPEDVAIISFDASYEGRCANPSLSSFLANDVCMGADAVDRIREIIDPGAPIIPHRIKAIMQFHTGESCGCTPVFRDFASSFADVTCLNSYNPTSDHSMEDIKIGQLLESYIMERFTSARTPEECLTKIFESVYLLYPYRKFALCLKENWLDTEDRTVLGYPEKMRVVVSHSLEDQNWFSDQDHSFSFDSKDMVPEQLFTEDDSRLYFFAPVHFEREMLGYTILVKSINDECRLNNVYRNWMRYLNNALEMTRDKQRLRILSTYDGMTGCLNRTGFNIEIERMIGEKQEGENCLFMVVDMDGLKKLNDTYGHAVGDAGICLISRALREVQRPGEIVVRAGGDEFYLIGVGHYTREDEEGRPRELRDKIGELNSRKKKPYEVTASAGCAVSDGNEQPEIKRLLHLADARMYEDKTSRKMNRE